MLRYADDTVVGFEHEADAHRFLDAMRTRLEEFSRSLHPEKTRLIEFGRHAAANRTRRGLGKPETFNFLGFTFICGKSRRGSFLMHRNTRGDRMRAKLTEVKEVLRPRMHTPIHEQGAWRGQGVAGFFAYHAVPTNFRALQVFRHHIKVLWRRSLKRRSQKDRTTSERVTKLVDDFLPQPRSFIPGPTSDSPLLTQGGRRMRESRTYYAGKPQVRCCAGGAP